MNCLLMAIMFAVGLQKEPRYPVILTDVNVEGFFIKVDRI